MKEIKKEGNFDTFLLYPENTYTICSEKYSWRPVNNDEIGESRVVLWKKM